MAMVELQPLIDAAVGELQVTLNYTKRSGEMVIHTVGIYEIGPSEKHGGQMVVWGWDVTTNDTIRAFLFESIGSYEVLAAPFFRPQPWPIKINGEIVKA